MLSISARLTTREFIRIVALPCLLYSLIFFGASEFLENWLYNKVSEPMIHLLHFVRGIASAIFVGAVVIWSLFRARESFKNEMDSITSLMSMAKSGLIAFDSEFNVLSTNLRASELLGSTYSSNFGKWVDAVKRKLEANHDSFECSNPLEDRQLKVLALHSQQHGYLILLDDITQQKALEEQYVIAEKMAAFGRIAGGLAHETGTPLNIISGRAEMLQALPGSLCPQCKVRASASIDKHIPVIFQQIERISGIIQQLLAQTKEEEQHPRKYSLNDYVEQVFQFLKPDLDREMIRVELQLSKDLPEIFGVPEQIRHVLVHLILNAIDAVKGRVGVLELSTARNNGNVLLSLRDNGIGISPENLTRIFDPFFTTKEFGKGTGLGLSVASNLVHSQGGRIEVESQPGQGTRFLITLPVRPAIEEPQPALQGKA